MPRHAPPALRELELWLNASIAEAERLLPDILDKSGGVLERELAARPELCTAGMMQRLITIAHELLEGYPRWAHELTSIAVKLLPSIAVPQSRVAIVRRLHAQAWIEHAQTSLGIRATAEARDAIDAARGLLDQTPAQEWYLATADVVEAQILHDLGRRDDAFTMVRRAGAHFVLHGDYDRYLHARMIEAWMFWSAGKHAEARNEDASKRPAGVDVHPRTGGGRRADARGCRGGAPLLRRAGRPAQRAVHRAGVRVTHAPRRIVLNADFEDALTQFAPQTANRLIRPLLRSIAENPTCAPALNGSHIRVLRTRGYAGHPAVCLYYAFDAEAVYPLFVEPYDELLP